MPNSLRIPWAQLVDNLTGHVIEDVFLPGAALEAGAVHYSEELHGRKRLEADNKAERQTVKDNPELFLSTKKRYQLLCGGCKGSPLFPGAEVHFQSSSRHRVGGMAPDLSEHFRTNPEQTHINCKFAQAVAKKSKRKYNQKDGYRLHLNIDTVGDHFNARSLTHSDSAGRLVYHNRRIANMQPWDVHNASDIIEFMKSCEPERLAKTVVIHRGYDPIPFHEFFLPRDEESRDSEPVATAGFKKLVESLKGRDRRSAFPVFMEVSFIKPIVPERGMTGARGISRSMLWEDDANDGEDHSGLFGQSRHIQPRVQVRNLNNVAMAAAVSVPGHRYILGHARLVSESHGDHITEFLDITATRPDQFGECVIAENAALPQQDGQRVRGYRAAQPGL